MNRRYHHWLIPLSLVDIAACQPASEAHQQPYAPYTNLQVLPPNIEWPELEAHMLENLPGLGLRRTGGDTARAITALTRSLELRADQPTWVAELPAELRGAR
jgi:hypothetical protein